MTTASSSPPAPSASASRSTRLLPPRPIGVADVTSRPMIVRQIEAASDVVLKDIITERLPGAHHGGVGRDRRRRIGRVENLADHGGERGLEENFLEIVDKMRAAERFDSGDFGVA